MTNGEQQLLDAGFEHDDTAHKWKRGNISFFFAHRNLHIYGEDLLSFNYADLQAITTRLQELNEKERTE